MQSSFPKRRVMSSCDVMWNIGLHFLLYSQMWGYISVSQQRWLWLSYFCPHLRVHLFICQAYLQHTTSVILPACCSNWLRGGSCSLSLHPVLTFRPSECHKDFHYCVKPPPPAVPNNRSGVGSDARVCLCAQEDDLSLPRDFELQLT